MEGIEANNVRIKMSSRIIGKNDSERYDCWQLAPKFHRMAHRTPEQKNIVDIQWSKNYKENYGFLRIAVDAMRLYDIT